MSEERLEELRKLYIGKVMSVEEMRERIPGVWVAVRGTEMDRDCKDIIMTGEILGIADDDHVSEELRKFEDPANTRIQVVRTTYGMNVGWLDGVLITKND